MPGSDGSFVYHCQNVHVLERTCLTHPTQSQASLHGKTSRAVNVARLASPTPASTDGTGLQCYIAAVHNGVNLLRNSAKTNHGIKSYNDAQTTRKSHFPKYEIGHALRVVTRNNNMELNYGTKLVVSGECREICNPTEPHAERIGNTKCLTRALVLT
jgi:hypothetical protein